jgi:hypothetical protein
MVIQMTDEDDGAMWPPAMFARQFQEAGEKAAEQQAEFARQLWSAGGGSDMANAGGMGLPGLAASSMGTATFKTRVQSGGRISIPDAEREALDIEEGDIVQTVLVPVKRTRSDTE